MNAPFWICYEETHPATWRVLPYAKTTEENRCRGFWLRRDALVRARRLRRMWLIWMLADTMRRIGKKQFTEEEFGKAWLETSTHRRVKLVVLDLRRSARLSGINPDDVVTMDAEMVRRGPMLASLPDGWLETAMAVAAQEREESTGLTIGQRWRPLDPRRKKGFMIARIEGDVVHGDDGREVKTSRLMKRYQPET